MRFFITVTICLLFTSSSALAERAEYCLASVEDQGWEVTETVTISGRPMVSHFYRRSDSGEMVSTQEWTTDHDTISITFESEETMVWNPGTDSLNRHGALMDWIYTAERMRDDYEMPPFAARDETRQIWLYNQIFVDGDEGCFAHPLDMPVR